MDGILLLDKPKGWTSHDAVDFLRRRLGQKKIGHAGTLDPMATGLLVMLVGSATKLSDRLMGFDKEYRGSIRLGTVTDTWDLEGRVLSQGPAATVGRHAVEEAVKGMRGSLKITPPAFSALKKEGKKYYELARQGVMLTPPGREVMISDFRVEDFVPPEVHVVVGCSKGTYVRSLAHQLGQSLGCGACLSSLRRTRIGHFSLDDALNAKEVEKMSLNEIELALIRHCEERSDEAI